MACAPMLTVHSAFPGTRCAPMYQSPLGVMPVMMQPIRMTMDPKLNIQMPNTGPTADFMEKHNTSKTVQKPSPTAKQKKLRTHKEGKRDCKPHDHQLGHRQRPATPAEEDAAGKGVISLLQEFVQCSKEFPVPQHRPILQWHFDTHIADVTALKFRAQVSFLLDGVAHHVAGSWLPSKRLAQRDAAERCLGFFVGRWSAFLLEHDSKRSFFVDSSAEEKTAVTILNEFCSSFAACEGQPPTWSQDCNGDKCQFFAELRIFRVPHTFAGAYLSNEDAAKADTAKRVLWYLQVPGFENAFEPDPKSPTITCKDMPSPPANWMRPAEEECDCMEAAQRKTALMRVQNRLQQVFGRQLKSGQSVWQWSYERDPADSAWPPLYKAKVLIPAAGQSFEGNWARGQREAQLETCKQVSAFLNSGTFESPSFSGRETPSSISPCSMGPSQSSTPGSMSSLESLDHCVTEDSK